MTDDRTPRVLDPVQADTQWPSGLQVLILPGVGGGPRYGGAFAPAAWELEEALTERGVSVAYAGGDPNHVILLESADWWGPILRVTEELATGVGGATLYDAIKTVLRRRRAREERGQVDGVTVHIAIQVVSERTPSEGETIVISDEEAVALEKLRELLGLVDK
ncbi:MAG: hypothetical protein JF887_09265 [Candidatus Dormibacteraeota bacterium]|uniref:Uncharacterized protein n=1 Tax=Candidatus Amunia macphersoniae TaxID=3127014 RepID=A0A934KFL1_9BACT|nr:hypothetical protein [Candidatus Dormibacteraeota bacterium]